MTTETKPKRFSFKFDVFSLMTLGVVLYMAFSAHTTNMKNAEKLNGLLSKYEQTLDAAIANDKVTLDRYQKNVKKAVQSLSPKERQLMLALLEIERKKEAL
ncbi:hypothetical protein CXF86_10655 [Shewanella sp. GutCb]|uniref:hypothetical protein n=1 Tax=Shewanella TaxID=22 RepID=UPI000C7D2B43|nr:MULTISPECIES: hypothetical protein [Shewanella]MCL1059005.1 hypothetical protein [Shewanella gelidimarina]PKG74749.1 hypothetical protein CXF86_10655 [Shewanella sp. GutCb]